MKKRLLVLLPLMMVTLTGCGGGGGGDYTSEIKIEFVDAAFGTKPYENIANAYMKDHPGVKVSLIKNRNLASELAVKLEDGTDLADITIYPRDEIAVKKWVRKGWVHNLKPYLTDVVENNQTFKDKLDTNALKAGNYSWTTKTGEAKDGFWCLPEYYNVSGFVYNSTFFTKNKLSTPKTMTEFKTLLDNICEISVAGNKVKPIVFCGESGSADGYLYYGTDGWMTAYEGVSNLDKFFAFGSADVYKPENIVGKQKGLEAVKDIFFDNFDKYVLPGAKAMDQKTAFSNLKTWKSVLMMQGSFFENDIGDTEGTEFKMFPTPEFDDGKGNIIHAEGYTTVDNKKVALANFCSTILVGEKAKNKTGAVDLIKYMTRESVTEQFTKDTNCIKPLNYNYKKDSEVYNAVSTFGKSILDIANDYHLYVCSSDADVSLIGKAIINPDANTETGTNYWFPVWYTRSSFLPSTCMTRDYTKASNNWDQWKKDAQEQLD